MLFHRELSVDNINTILTKFDDPEIWTSISSNQELDSDFVDKYQDKLNWFELSENYNFSDDEIKKYNLKINVDQLANNDNYKHNWSSE